MQFESVIDESALTLISLTTHTVKVYNHTGHRCFVEERVNPNIPALVLGGQDGRC